MPLKLIILALVTTLVLFPDPRLLVRDIQHLSNLDAMIDARDPDLQKWVADFHDRVAKSPSPATQPADLQRAAERYVYEHVPYQWDWVLYGSADYMPTV